MTDLQQLIDRWLDGEITELEFGALNSCLSENPLARQTFVEQVQLHSLLRKRHRENASLQTGLAVKPPDSLLESRPLLRSSGGRRLPGLKSVVVAVTAAVGLVLLAQGVNDRKLLVPPGGARPRDVSPPVPAASASLAAVGRIEMATAEVGLAAWKNGILYPGDRVRFDRGFMRLRFLVGATVVLEGPADLEIASAMRTILHAGQATADVETSGHGFTIATPTADIVDLGTKFGVRVQDGAKSDVVVFEGEVDVGKPPGLEGPLVSGQRLRTGEALRVGAGGERARIPMIWQRPSEAGMEWSSRTEFSGGSAITLVRDNRPTTSRPKFYAINPGAFGSEARAYVDRPYVWTGWNGEALPEELVGGDYVQTFCDNKEAADLAMHVGISAPAHVYVLFDTRLKPVPEWLTTSFVDTGRSVALKGEVIAFLKIREELESQGLDPDPALINPETGKFQRYRFSVWRRDISSPGEVFLGAVASSTRSMYGIVVVPQ